MSRHEIWLGSWTSGGFIVLRLPVPQLVMGIGRPDPNDRRSTTRRGTRLHDPPQRQRSGRTGRHLAAHALPQPPRPRRPIPRRLRRQPNPRSAIGTDAGVARESHHAAARKRTTASARGALRGTHPAAHRRERPTHPRPRCPQRRHRTHRAPATKQRWDVITGRSVRHRQRLPRRPSPGLP